MGNLSSTADDILACARSLIVTGGYNGFSYADIAEVCLSRPRSTASPYMRHSGLLFPRVGHLAEREPDPAKDSRREAGGQKLTLTKGALSFASP